MATPSGNTARWPRQFDHIHDKRSAKWQNNSWHGGKFGLFKKTQEVTRYILWSLSNETMGLKARVRVAKTRGEGRICVS